MRYAFIAISALAMATTAASVTAQDFVVQHADLDLSTAQGQKALEKRIDTAAKAYCGGGQRTGTRMRNPETAKCIAQVKQAASEQMLALVDEETRKGG